MVQLILASQSPRRRNLIRLTGQTVKVVSAMVDEESIDHPDPRENVIRTAELKARTVGAQFPEACVIAADTTVAIDGELLAKPADADEATAMLKRLRGRAHQVHTGLVVLQPASGQLQRSVCTTEVVMRAYTDEEIARYVASGDPFDKAGAYAIQHASFSPVAQIQGCYSNVVGLSLCQLSAKLRLMGIRTDLDVAEQTSDFRECRTCLKLISEQRPHSGPAESVAR